MARNRFGRVAALRPGLVVLTDRRLLSAGPIHRKQRLSPPGKYPLPGLDTRSYGKFANSRSSRHGHVGTFRRSRPASALALHGRQNAARPSAGRAFRPVFARAINPRRKNRLRRFWARSARAAGRSLTPDQEVCPDCEISKAKPPVQSLLRLKRFARPQIGDDLAGLRAFAFR